MNFELNKAIEILSRTPSVISSLLSDLSDDWLHSNEGKDTWSPYQIAAHLVYGEKADWLGRVNIILFNDDKKFIPFDRFAHLAEDMPINEVLSEFKTLRKNNIQTLLSYNITDKMLELKGIHPAFGEVTLRQLLSSWIVHDLGHIAQISRVLAKQYKQETGPWIEYLPILNK
jgi:uncharacterized damage-inducible protein DinB